jgi:hypothetical protein
MHIHNTILASKLLIDYQLISDRYVYINLLSVAMIAQALENF